MSRENAFVLLELDPGAGLKWPAIELVLKRKKTEWSMPHPSRKLEYQQYRSWVPELEAVLRDDARRKQEADEAVKILKKQRAGVMQELDNRVAVTGAKGYLTEDDVKTLTSAGTGRYAEKEVRDRAAARKLTIRKPAPAATAKPRLDASLEKEIRSFLLIAGASDLYALLDVQRSTTTTELRRRADEKYQEVRTHGDKTRADVNARDKLLGHCLKIFDDEAQRAKYDSSLASERLKDIEDHARTAGAGEKRLRAAVSDELIRLGRKKGLSQEEVVAVLVEIAAQGKWVLEVPAAAPSPSPACCGNCGDLGAPGAKGCPACGMPYEIACPKCKAINPTAAQICCNVSCRFEVGNMHLAERSLRSAKAIQREDPRRASVLAAEALGYWPGHPEAATLKADLDRAEAEIQILEQAIRKAIGERTFEAIHRPLADLARQAPDQPELAEWRRHTDRALAETAGHVTRARAHETAGRIDEALSAFDAALAVCTDCQAAKDGQNRCPPAAPTNLRVTATVTGVSLNWNASPTRGRLEYLVVRRSGSPPTRPSDGETVVRTPGLTYLDAAAEPGKHLYYAIFTERGTARSHQSTSAGPLVRPAEVADLKAIARDGAVTLQWTPPPGATAVEVWRMIASPPSGRGVGFKVTAVTLASATDTVLTNNVVYGYRVVAVFNGTDGRAVLSGGITISSMPSKPPQPVKDLSVVRLADEFQATWTSPSIANVQLRILEQRPLLKYGDLVSCLSLTTLGRIVPASGPGRANGKLDQKGIAFLLPITILGDTAVIGRSIPLTWVDDVEQLKVAVDGGEFSATWRWPKGVDSVLATWRPDDYPSSPTDPKAKQHRCARSEYDRHGGLRRPLPATDRFFVAVYASVECGGEWQFASGAAPGARAIVNSALCCRAAYRILAERRFGFLRTGQHVLELNVDNAVELPELVLVAKSGGMPLDPTNGVVVLRIPARTSCCPKDPFRAAFPSDSLPTNWKARLFPSNAVDADRLDLVNDT
jgi:hypothetical protein